MFQDSKYKLEHIDIEINHRCNLACKHCSARASRKNGVNELSVSQLKEILRQGKELGLMKIGLTGGEPLFDEEKLSQISNYCVNDLNIPIHTHTNGNLVREDMCDTDGILTLFESVSVTFLGGKDETHDKMTGIKGSFEKAFKAAKIISDYNLPLTCYYIPTRGTCFEYKYLSEKLSKIGVKRIRAMALAPSGRARSIYEETAPNKEEIRQFERELLESGEKFNLHIEAGNCTRLSMPGLAILSGHQECMSGINRVHINSKGNVYPCTAASGVKELNLGNLFSNGNTLRDIWRDSIIVKNIRKIHNSTLQSCNSCTVPVKCKNGCIVNTIGTMYDREISTCPLLS